MSEENYKNLPSGLINSPPDSRDYSLSKLMSVVGISPYIPESEPDIFEYEVPDIKDQNDIWMCVSASGCAQREIVEKQQSNNEYKRLSMGFNYAYRDSGDLQEKGLRIREYLKGLVKYGIPEFEYFPIQNKEYPDIKNDINHINLPKILQNSFQHRITAYAQIKKEEIKTALRTLGPIMTSINIYSSFSKISASNPIIPIPNVNTEQVFSKHCMLIIGYDNKTKLYKIVNSQGKNFGQNGCCYASYDYPFDEIWSLTDLEKKDYIHDFKFTCSIDKNEIAINDLVNLNCSTFDGDTPLGTQTIECVTRCGNLSHAYTLTTNSKGIADKVIYLTKEGQTKITCTWVSPDNQTHTKTLDGNVAS